MKKNNTAKDILNRIQKDLKNNGVGLIAAAICFILFVFIFKEVCPMQIMFGIPCPGCGLTRAGILVLQGKFKNAFIMNPFIYVWMVFLFVIAINRYVRGVKNKYAMKVLIVIIFAMVFLYIYRMAVWFPDKEPMTFSKHRSIIDVKTIYQNIKGRR